MGATANYKSISPWALELLKGHPWLVEPFVCWMRYDTQISPLLDTMPAEKRAALLARIGQAFPPDGKDYALIIWEHREPQDFARVRGVLPRLKSEWDRPSLDLDKTWRGILHHVQRCSKRTADVITRALSSGVPLGANLGYAPAEYHDAATTEELADALEVAAQEYGGLGADFSREVRYLADYYRAARAGELAMLLFLA